MNRYFVLLRDWKINVKTVFGVIVFSIFMFPGLVTALQTALVRTSDGEVYQIHFSTQDSAQNPIKDFSIYDARGRVKICLDWYEKEGEAGQRWRPVAAELWAAAELLARTPRRTRVYNTSALVNSFNEAAEVLMPSIKDEVEKTVVSEIVSEAASHTPLQHLNIIPKGHPVASIAMPANFIAKLGVKEIKMRRLLYAYWLASGYAETAIQLQTQANQRAQRLWNAINANQVVDIFGGDLNLDGETGRVQGKVGIDGPLRLRLVAEVYQETAEKAAALGVDLAENKGTWTNWLVGLTGVGGILQLLEEVGGALETKGALQQLYDSIGYEIGWSLRRNVEGVYDSAYSFYKGGFCEPGVDVLVYSGDNIVDEGSGFTYTVVLKTQPNRNVTVNVSSDNTDVIVSPTSRIFTPKNWYMPKTFKVRTLSDTDRVNDRGHIKHAVRGYGNITSANEVLVIVVDRDPVIVGELPEQTPQPPASNLRVGDAIIVQNTLNIGLNIRGGAGTAWNSKGRAFDGATGTITDGPVSKNGYTWWKVQWHVSNNVVWTNRPVSNQGWSVETLPEEGVRLIVPMPKFPDLVVESPRVNKNTLVPGERFTLSTTLRNLGTGRSAATRLRYYQSSDAYISTNDTQIGIVDLGPLSSGVTRHKNFRMTAPNVPGTYYYGACVDGVQGETDRNNNCSQAIAITVQPPRVPDLMIGSVSVSKASVAPGEDFTLTTKVQNIGTGDARTTFLRYSGYGQGVSGKRSSVPRLAANAVSPEKRITLKAPLVEGAYVYEVCVSDVVGESNTNNNCATVTVTVETVPVRNQSPRAVGTISTQTLAVNDAIAGHISGYFNDPDGDSLTYTARSDNTNVVTASMSGDYLTLTAQRAGSTNVTVTVSDGSSTATQRFTVQVQSVQGTQPGNQPPSAIGTISPITLTSNGTTWRTNVSGYFRDADGDNLTYTARSDNTNVATVRVSGAEVTITPRNAGSTTIHVTASDGVSTASQSLSVTITSAPPVQDPTSFDLDIQSVSVSKSTVAPSESFTLSITIHNNGPAASGVFSLSYYYSLIQGRTPEDQIHREGTVQLDPLASGANTTKSFTLNAPSTPRTYYYGAWLSGIADDTNLYNNVATEVGLTVRTVQAPDVPDLVVQSTRVDKNILSPGERFKFYATVRNQGAAEANRATLRYYRSTDSSISRSDTQVDTDSVISLDPNESDEEWENLRAPNSAGTYYYGVCIDSVNDESNTSNNCSNAIRITVEVLTPDLVVESISASESTVEPGERFRLSATVRNRGSGDARSTRLRYYRSSDASISTSDTEVDTDSVSSLDADETSDEWDNITAPDTPGTYYFGACVDSVRDESNTSNNCSNAVRITVQGAQQPAGLGIGDSIFVQNASGGGLNGLIVRSGAGTGFKHIISAFNGATGTIKDGPKQNNGYTWWKVRWDHSNVVFCDVNPCDGWVFEFFNGVRVIAKPGLAAPTLNAAIPKEMILLPNYPNPFNPETWIPYQLSEASDVTVSIYSVNGMLVRKLNLGHQPAGIYQSRSRAAYWDGCNEFGERVASGLYFYTLTAGEFSATRKMLILK